MQNGGNKSIKQGKKTAKKPNGERKNKKPVPFVVEAVYTLQEAAPIIRRNPATLRKIAQRGRIAHGLDAAGYLFSGRALQAYAEGRCLVDESEVVKTLIAKD